MVALAVPRRRIGTRQPQQAVGINWAHPLTRGLTRLLVFNRGALPFDLVTRTFATQVNSFVSSSVIAGGRGLRVTNDTFSYWTIPIITETVANFSLGWVGRMDGGAAPMAARDNTSTGGTICQFLNAGTWYTRIGGNTMSSVGAPALGVPYAGVTTNGPAGTSLIVNRQVLLSNATGAGSAALVSPWTLTQNGINGQGMIGTTLLMPIWSRKITDREGLSFTGNPWQLLAPVNDSIWVPSSAAALFPTLSNPRMTGITAHGGVPTVDYTF